MILLATAAIMFLVLSFATNQMLCNNLPRFVYLFFMFPGVVLHELSHAVAVILTGGQISDINFFSTTGGHVKHTPSKVPVLGQFVISFAPMVVGLTVIFLLARLIPVTQSGAFNIPFSSWQLPKLALSDGFHWWQIVIAYLLLSISVTLIPSRQDVSASVAGILVIVFIVIILYINKWLTIPATLSAYIWYINIGLALAMVALSPLKIIKKK